MNRATPSCRHPRLRVEEHRFADGYNRVVEVCQNNLCEAWARAAIKPKTEAAKTGKVTGKAKATGKKKKGEVDLSKLSFKPLTIADEWEARGSDLLQTQNDVVIITRMPQTNRAAFRRRAMAWFDGDDAALERALTATAMRAFGAPSGGCSAAHKDFPSSKTRAKEESQADGSTAVLSQSRSGGHESTPADPAHPSRSASGAHGKGPTGPSGGAGRRAAAAQPEPHDHGGSGGSSYAERECAWCAEPLSRCHCFDEDDEDRTAKRNRMGFE